jgi:hypothetical protein
VVGAVPRVLQRFHCHHRHPAVSGQANFFISSSHTTHTQHTHTQKNNFPMSCFEELYDFKRLEASPWK